MSPLVFFVGILAFFWLLIVLPQRRRRRRQVEVLSHLAPGDEVITVGGLYGSIREVADDHVVLDIAPDTAVRAGQERRLGAPGARAGACRAPGDLANLRRSTVAERRSHLILVGLILVALIGAALLAVPGSPIHRSRDARPRSPGRPRGRQESGPRKGPEGRQVRGSTTRSRSSTTASTARASPSPRSASREATRSSSSSLASKTRSALQT